MGHLQDAVLVTGAKLGCKAMVGTGWASSYPGHMNGLEMLLTPCKWYILSGKAV